LIEDRLILQEAKRMQIKSDESMVEERIRDIKFRAGGELAFEKALTSQGITLNELRVKLRDQFLIYAVIQREVKSKANISPKEVTEYYEAHKSEFASPETLVVDSLFAKDKETLVQAEKQLQEGKEFQEVAKTYSEKASLGSVSKGQLKKNLEDYIFGLKVGQYSKPFEAEDGFYIFLVREKVPPSEKLLEEVRQPVMAALENEKTARILKGWLEELKDKAYISIRE